MRLKKKNAIKNLDYVEKIHTTNPRLCQEKKTEFMPKEQNNN